MSLPSLTIPRLGLAAFRSRLLVRGIFFALMLAVLALAVVLLSEEKKRSYQHYQNNIGRTQAEVMAKLRHPAGVLALINARFTRAGSADEDAAGVRPLLLPFGALDFDDIYKAQQAIEISGCSIQFADQSSLCAGVGSNPYAGGFIYLVGEFQTGALVGRERGQLDLGTVHRVRLRVSLRGKTTHWLAPLEVLTPAVAARMSLRGTVAGRLPGFLINDDSVAQLEREIRPARDFRAWMWQRASCDANGIESKTGARSLACLHRTWFSMRVPVAEFQADLFDRHGSVTWPPSDLDRIKVALQILSPAGQGGPPTVAFDSQSPQILPPFSLQDLSLDMQPGETLHIYELDNPKRWVVPAVKSGSNAPLYTVRGLVEEGNRSPLITHLIRWLPVQSVPNKLERRDRLSSPVGRYEIVSQSDVQGVDKNLSAVATRLSWFVAAMLGALLLAWMLIELGFIRRIARLTKRAATVSKNMPDSHGDSNAVLLKQLEFNDLRGSDEVGILAGSLAELLQRVKEDVQRAQIRAQQEREMWHAVGHEIVSPLQSLLVLHQAEEDPSRRYIRRIQQAVRVLYGQASPSEAIEAAHLELEGVNVVSFLAMVAENAHFSGIGGVCFVLTPGLHDLQVRADEFSLEDVLTHVLRNAARHRKDDTPITLSLSTGGASMHRDSQSRPSDRGRSAG